jgi:hypothetical protein
MRRFWGKRSRYEKALLVIFLLSIPFIRARIQWDGVGYYAYLRSPLVDHNFQFANDWHDPAQDMFLKCRVCPEEVKQYWNHPANQLLIIYLDRHFYANPITKTGHLPNFYTVGPAILWSPFVVPTHFGVLVANRLGFEVAADGHSKPYLVALSFATALYGFLGLWFSFELARKYVEERWAFWATVGLWFASSVPVYMYLNPSWSHAHSLFTVALFLWYWDRTRGARTAKQWAVLGLFAGLMMDVYLANFIFLLAPAADCFTAYFGEQADWREARRHFGRHVLFSACVILAFLPMLITRQIVFGNPFVLGMYAQVPWHWKSAAFLPVLFSSGHGIFVWTPILLVALLGLLPLWRKKAALAGIALLMSLAFYALISVYPWWYGTLSFGNRFFVSLTPIFVLGLAAGFAWFGGLWSDGASGVRRLVPLLVLLVVWNFGLIYQWSTHMVPTPGEVYWSEVVYNQFRVVPGRVLHDVATKSPLRVFFSNSKVQASEAPRGDLL